MATLLKYEVLRGEARHVDQSAATWHCQSRDSSSREAIVQRVKSGRRVLRVLVVNDNQGQATEIVTLIRHWGHAVRMANDGLTALRAAADQHPDVLLIDLELPGLDGCQVARQLRLNVPPTDCFIIGVAKKADAALRRECIEAGIDLLLQKPLDLSIVETLLMLECVHVNLSHGIDGAYSTGPEHSLLALQATEG